MSCRAFLQIGGLTAVLLADLPVARAFVSYVNLAGQPQKWSLVNPSPWVHTNVVNRSTHAVRYFLGADAYSSGNQVAELNAARACFDQWQAVPGTVLRFEEGGVMAGKLDVNTADNTNVIYWTKTSTIVNGGLDNISGATGVTFSDFFSDGTVAEADIVLNGVQFTWFADFSNTVNQGQFIESVLLHEIGHLLGLDHSPIGAATMFPHGGPGVSVQAGLSSDEISALHSLYPAASIPATLGQLTGQVTLGGQPVLGAVVVADDAAGNIAAGTLTRTNGQYQMQGLLPGAYQVHVAPMDPASTPAAYALLRGSDISAPFAATETGFQASPGSPVVVKAAATATLNFAVSGTPSLRINGVIPPTGNFPAAIQRGQQTTVRVYSFDLPAPDALLRVSGDGLTFGPTTIMTNAFPGVVPPLNLLSVPVDVAADATPGMRSFIVQQASGLTYANGFIQVAPPFPDYNFDGLDDRFQRQYFPRWTAPEAGPNADPDGDGFTNAQEDMAGTNPVDARSVPRVQSMRLDAAGATITWPSATERRYQVLKRSPINGIRGWQPVGSPVIATGDQTQFTDTTASGDFQFYRIEALPRPTQ
jgi:Matrixin/Carboxypeptidase regulatory-like domain